MNGAANCPECGSRMAIRATNHGGGITFRVAECDCGERWELEERRARRLPAVGTRVQSYTAAGARPPPPTVANPPSSGGGIGGPLPGVVGQSSVSDPNPKASLLSGTRVRARIKTPANPHFPEMRDLFVKSWEERYQDKYIFQAKDGACLGKMLREAPHLVERWPDMVDRYLADSFWASKRHPLTGLATRPVEFAGEVNAPVRQDKWTDSRKTAIEWAHREQRKVG